MRELIAEILGWLGYLERGSVQLQLLLLAAVLLGLRLHWTRQWLRRWPRAVAPCWAAGRRCCSAWACRTAPFQRACSSFWA